MPVVVQIMRAESLTEVPVIGRLLTTSAAKRSGPAVPEEVLAAQEQASNGRGEAGRRRAPPASPAMTETALPPLRPRRRAPQPRRQRVLRGLRSLLVRRAAA